MRGSTTSSGGGIYVADETEATFERCAILGCLGKYGGGAYAAGTAKFYDCLIAGCKATIGGGLSSVGATTVNGSTVAGCVASEGAACVRVSSGSFTATNSIFVGVIAASVSPVYSGCVAGVASSQIGFVVPPPDDLTVENWDANAWQSWDLRLLDDASGAPSPYRDSGAVGEMSQYDLQGNFRGRETNGATSCSPGAYETLQADLFWIGVEIDPTAPSDLKVADYDAEAKTLILSWTPNLADATGYDVQYSMSGTGWANLSGAAADATSRLCGGLSAAKTYIYRIRAHNAVGATAWSTIAFMPRALDEATAETGTREVVSPSLLASNGWAASRFATVSGDAAPQVGQTLFVGRDVAFVDALATSSNQRHGLYVGGGTVVAFESDARLFLGKLQIAANARLAFNRGAAESSRFGAFSRVDGAFMSLPNAVADDNVYIASAIVYATVISEPTYGTLNVLTSIDVSVERMSGVYVCNAFRIQQNGTKVGQTITVSDGTTIRARSVNFGSADAANYVESFFSRPVTLKLQGAASVSMPSTTRES
ncbi:MAG: fibronectin type III domain-containing protein, partial [Thermoguttaceae bacterium]|nr:fibronectin type III domain-containing protein [Thermoguttaceae bacterium]